MQYYNRRELELVRNVFSDKLIITYVPRQYITIYDRIQNKVPKNKFGRHGTTRGLQTNKIGTVLCLARCVIFNIVKGQLCPQSLCGWIGDCPGNERD